MVPSLSMKVVTQPPAVGLGRGHRASAFGADEWGTGRLPFRAAVSIAGPAICAWQALAPTEKTWPVSAATAQRPPAVNASVLAGRARVLADFPKPIRSVV